MCSLTRTTFRIRLGVVFVRVYGLGFDDPFLVMRCCFISVFPPPEEALFLYVWNFKGVWVQVCVCLTWLASEVYTYLVHTSVAGHVMCTCIIYIYMYIPLTKSLTSLTQPTTYIYIERERGMVCVFVCMCVSVCVYLTPYPSIYVTRIQEEQNKMQKNK